MTDRETLEAMLTRAGVEFASPEDFHNVVHVEANERTGGPNLGYSGFFTEFTFDDLGFLVSVGSWE